MGVLLGTLAIDKYENWFILLFTKLNLIVY